MDETNATPLVLAAITSVLQDPSAAATPEATSRISQATATKLHAAFPTSKIVCQTLLLPAERGGSGLTMSTTAVWDTSSDTTFNVRWENKEWLCIVSVVAVACA
jgi:hypothetical protein